MFDPRLDLSLINKFFECKTMIILLPIRFNIFFGAQKKHLIETPEH